MPCMLYPEAAAVHSHRTEQSKIQRTFTDSLTSSILSWNSSLHPMASWSDGNLTLSSLVYAIRELGQQAAYVTAAIQEISATRMKQIQMRISLFWTSWFWLTTTDSLLPHAIASWGGAQMWSWPGSCEITFMVSRTDRCCSTALRLNWRGPRWLQGKLMHSRLLDTGFLSFWRGTFPCHSVKWSQNQCFGLSRQRHRKRADLAPDLLRPTVQVYRWGGGNCMRGWISAADPCPRLWLCPRVRSEDVCSWCWSMRCSMVLSELCCCKPRWSELWWLEIVSPLLTECRIRLRGRSRGGGRLSMELGRSSSKLGLLGGLIPIAAAQQ